MLTISDLQHTYRDGSGSVTALTLPSFTAETGSQWCLTGPSGSGKSTLLHCISGLIRPTQGTVMVDDFTVTAPPSPDHSHALARSPRRLRVPNLQPAPLPHRLRQHPDRRLFQ